MRSHNSIKAEAEAAMVPTAQLPLQQSTAGKQLRLVGRITMFKHTTLI
jgi:hypothetical protein